MTHDLTPSQILALEMMRDIVLKLKTAIDEGYLDPHTLEIREEELEFRSGNRLRGGFNGDFRLKDLEDEVDFWRNEKLRGVLLTELGLPAYGFDECNRFLAGVERVTKERHESAVADPAAIFRHAFKLIFADERMPNRYSALSIFHLLWCHAGPDGKTDVLTYKFVAETYDVRAHVFKNGLKLLGGVRLVRPVSAPGGFTYELSTIVTSDSAGRGFS